MRILHAAALTGVLLCVATAAAPLRALDAVTVRRDTAAIDLTDAVEVQHAPPGTYGRIHISAAPDADRVARPIEVRVRDSSRSWATFALTNNSDAQVDRLLVVPHYQMVGSGLLRPDLGRKRVAGIVPSSGAPPEPRDESDADVFLVTLDPGTVTTFAAELRADDLPQVYLWQADAYHESMGALALYRGILFGAAGLLALLLTILFVARGGRALAAASALGWTVLVYLGTEVGVWGRLLDLSDAATRIWRAAGEAMLAAAFAACLFACLERPRAAMARMIAVCAGLCALLIAAALFDAPAASGIARLSLGVIAVAGLAYLIRAAVNAVGGAMQLIPSWLLLGAWVLAAGLAVDGVMTGDRVAPTLLGALVVITFGIGATLIVKPE